MTKPAQPSVLTFARRLWGPALALALICALTMIAPRPALAQTFQVIHNFTGGADGAQPYVGLTMVAGNLYGTAALGGVIGG